MPRDRADHRGQGADGSRSSTAWVIIGEITRPHGIKGYVRIHMHTDYPHRFDHLEEVYLQRGDEEPRPWGFRVVGRHQGQLICELGGVSGRDSAEGLRGQLVVLPREMAVKPPPGTYFIFDLVGLAVHTVEGVHLGTLTEVLQPGANDVYVVKMPGSDQEILLPAIKDVIQEVNLKDGRMLVSLLPGLV